MAETESPARQSLSVLIITKDEEDRIERCLESTKELADEIIVLDSGSTDKTLDIVARYTDKFFSTDWPGYGRQKQRALDKARCDWVLSIDADEALDREMQQWLTEFLAQEQRDVVGARLPWGVTVYGKRLDHGRSARAPLRLVRRAGASFTDAQVHEELRTASGTIVRANGRLLHFTSRNYGHSLEKNVNYSWLSSQKYFDSGRRCHSLTIALLKSWWVFFLVYIVRRGFLDGPVGFLVAINYAQNSFNKYAGLWTLTREEKRAAKNEQQ
ncbi:glycosyltransferase family 2 protein [Congregibacter sp.]|uniref:glycosyltransferase family 2 protein n=1 Tax=Congregibacter sp. TaxID=2744308 RepID=UPI003F6D7E91